MTGHRGQLVTSPIILGSSSSSHHRSLAFEPSSHKTKTREVSVVSESDAKAFSVVSEASCQGVQCSERRQLPRHSSQLGRLLPRCYPARWASPELLPNSASHSRIVTEPGELLPNCYPARRVAPDFFPRSTSCFRILTQLGEIHACLGCCIIHACLRFCNIHAYVRCCSTHAYLRCCNIHAYL